MKIKSIDINNGLQHKKLKANFTDFNVIIGPNGCGKSSVIELMGYGLTNKFTWPGTLETMITTGEEKGDVTLVIEHEGEELTLKTALGKTSRKLVRGDLKINKSAEVIEYVQEVLLRTPFELVNEASIVRQGYLDAGLFTTQAKRQQIFQRLAGLNNIEMKRKQLADAKSLCTPFMLSFDLDEKKRQVQELLVRTRELKSEYAALSVIKPDQAKYDQCKVLLTNLGNIKKYSEEQVELDVEQKTLSNLYTEANSELTAASTMLGNLNGSLEVKRPDYERALGTVASARAVADHQANRQRLELQLSHASTALEQLGLVPESFEGQPEIEEFESIHQEALNEIKQAERVRDNLSAEDKKCPTCHTVLADPAAIIASSVATIDEMQVIGETASARLRELRGDRNTWENDLNEYRRKISELNTTVANTTTSLTAMTPVEGAITDPAAAQLVIDEYAKLSTSAREVQVKHAAVQVVFTEVDTALKVCTTKVDAVNRNLAGLSSTEGSTVSVLEATNYVSVFDEHKDKLAAVTGQLTEVSRQSEENMKSLHETEDKAEEAKKYKEYSDHIEFAKSALHRDNFPAGKIKAFIDKVLYNSEAYLEAMQAGFTVSYEHENGFIAHFPEKDLTIRADRLSGGEQVIFALAFRFAVNEVKSETGFLILDEPTAHLDDEHVDSVVRVLELVKRKLAGRVQLFVVTHNEKMAAVADTVLEVNRASA